MNPEQYGEIYWCVKSNLSPDGEIYLHADIVEVGNAGQLICSRKNSDVMMIFKAENWECIFAASVIDGCACCVEHWRSEVVR